MSAPDPKRGLSDIPEAAVISRLLSEVTRTLPGSGAVGERAEPPAPVTIVSRRERDGRTSWLAKARSLLDMSA